jgi:hypothetical protein
MFGELPKLFDRNFAVGFFLPIAVFITLTEWILGPFFHGPDLRMFFESNLLAGTTVIGLLTWVGGIVLVAINRDLYRLIEGYGKYNPLRLFTWSEKLRYFRINRKLSKLDEKYQEYIVAKKAFPIKLQTNRNELIRKLAEEFPDKEDFILPTPFGNVLRSFEIYPRVMYGFDAMDAWGRLLTVIPKDYLALIDAAKAQVDFWINLGVVIVIILIEYLALGIATGRYLGLNIVVLLALGGIITQIRAVSSAKEWGDFVKSAFDVYRFKLLESLGVELPKDRNEEKVLWSKYSQAILYRLPETLPELRPSTNKTVAKRAKSKK